MKFVLIVFVMLSNSMNDVPSATTAEFNTRAACDAAARDVEATVSRMHPNLMIIARCYEKGG